MTANKAEVVAQLAEALQEARLTLEVMQGRGSSVGLTIAIIDRALQAAEQQPDPTDMQILAITTAYAQGVGKGHDAHHRGEEIQNPYGTSWGCDKAWQMGYEEGKEQVASGANSSAINPDPRLLCRGEPVGFCEDTALSLAERTFSSEVDEQLAEDVIQYARRLHDLYTAPQPALDVAVLVEALEWLRGAINCTPENDKHKSGTWISTKHPRIRKIDELLAAHRKQQGASHDPK